ncbi:MAG: pyridoxamine 5'-phosphate oxidase family protein [Microthrixaceae bacterium]|nr:pyridoxamine 5'-phosphate oxidase family protein [Microthrixaceae bacterium]MCO5322790.1 pyridoxamine 5'-phosphate oxidase family protein [Microthrixaceae bacterium]
MLERPEDLDALQRTLDESYRNAGEHLKQIHEPQRRPDAAGLAQLLQGMCLLTLATVTRDGRPITGAVDGVFYRGAFHFGSSPESVRFGHIRQRPEVSATHLPGEHLAVTVHGTAQPLDLAAEEHAEFRQLLLDIYLPRFGDDWLEVLDGGVYARIDARRVFAFWMPEESG